MNKVYGKEVVESSGYYEVQEMYKMIVVERNVTFYREMYLKSQSEQSYIEFLDKYYKRNIPVISDFEKQELEDVFEGVNLDEVI